MEKGRISVSLITLYLRKNKISVAVLAYLVLSVLLKTATGIDVTAPCLIKLTTGHSCWGCGLTTATVHLLKLQFALAWETNALVFIALPAIAFMLIRDWMQFLRNQTSSLL